MNSEMDNVFRALEELTISLNKMDSIITYNSVEVTFNDCVKVYTNAFVRNLFKNPKVTLKIASAEMMPSLQEFDRRIATNSAAKFILHDLEDLCTPTGYDELLGLYNRFMSFNFPKTCSLLNETSIELPSETGIERLGTITVFTADESQKKLLKTLSTSKANDKDTAMFVVSLMKKHLTKKFLDVISK